MEKSLSINDSSPLIFQYYLEIGRGSSPVLGIIPPKSLCDRLGISDFGGGSSPPNCRFPLYVPVQFCTISIN